MKKLINDPEDVVAQALLGIEAARPDVRVDHANRIIYRRDAPKAGKVGLVSGGGSGHEPLHGGFVGLGMLDAACAGQIFTSPTPDQMLEARIGRSRHRSRTRSSPTVQCSPRSVVVAWRYARWTRALTSRSRSSRTPRNPIQPSASADFARLRPIL